MTNRQPVETDWHETWDLIKGLWPKMVEAMTAEQALIWRDTLAKRNQAVLQSALRDTYQKSKYAPKLPEVVEAFDRELGANAATHHGSQSGSGDTITARDEAVARWTEREARRVIASQPISLVLAHRSRDRASRTMLRSAYLAPADRVRQAKLRRQGLTADVQWSDNPDEWSMRGIARMMYVMKLWDRVPEHRSTSDEHHRPTRRTREDGIGIA